MDLLKVPFEGLGSTEAALASNGISWASLGPLGAKGTVDPVQGKARGRAVTGCLPRSAGKKASRKVNVDARGGHGR